MTQRRVGGQREIGSVYEQREDLSGAQPAHGPQPRHGDAEREPLQPLEAAQRRGPGEPRGEPVLEGQDGAYVTGLRRRPDPAAHQMMARTMMATMIHHTHAPPPLAVPVAPPPAPTGAGLLGDPPGPGPLG